MVAINLYPFKQTIMKDGVALEDAIENIDIGGPTMIRAAAKNYQDVAVVVDPADYKTVIDEYKANGAVSADTKFMLAYKVFEHGELRHADFDLFARCNWQGAVPADAFAHV